MKIIIEDYNSEWENYFKVEKELLKNSFKDPEIIIEHIGSTSVKGLGAKPVIDILIGVPDFSIVNKLYNSNHKFEI